MVARGLQHLGIGVGDAVVVYELNSIEYFVIVNAIQMVGATAIQINWRLTSDEALYVLENSDAVAVFLNESFLPVVEGIVERISIENWIIIGEERRPWAKEYREPGR